MGRSNTTPIGTQNPNLLKNYFINGGMAIAQRGTSIAAPASGSIIADRWQFNKAGSAVHTMSQSTDVPTFAQSGHNFTNSLRLNLTTASNSIGANDYYDIRQNIEGYNFAALSQKPFTVSFWIKSSSTGKRSVGVRNGGSDRSCFVSFNITAANTWQKVVAKFPASPSSGTWNFTNGMGLAVRIALAYGTNFQNASEGQWLTGNFVVPPDMGNGVATGSTDTYITGAMLNEGDLAAPFRLFAEGMDGELIACQRYFEKSYDLGDAIGSAVGAGRTDIIDRAISTSGTGGVTWDFKVTKRAMPTMTAWSQGGAINTCEYYGASSGTGNPNLAASERRAAANLTGGAGLATNTICSMRFQWAADAEL